MLANRISAVIIQDKKILLVTDKEKKVYWTPGGKVDEGETHEEALKRELSEELKINLVSTREYINYKTFNEVYKQKQEVYCYFVKHGGTPIPSQEIGGCDWFSRDNLPKMRYTIETILIPKLLEDGLL